MGGVYRIFLGLYWPFIGEGLLKEWAFIRENTVLKFLPLFIKDC